MAYNITHFLYQLLLLSLSTFGSLPDILTPKEGVGEIKMEEEYSSLMGAIVHLSTI